MVTPIMTSQQMHVEVLVWLLASGITLKLDRSGLKYPGLFPIQFISTKLVLKNYRSNHEQPTKALLT